MVTKEAIREGITRQIWCCSVNIEMKQKGKPYRYLPKEFVEQRFIDKKPYYEAADLILKEESEQGAVLKVERALPENPYEDHVHLDAGKYDGLYRKTYFEAQQDMVAAGFDTAFESLV